MRQSLQHKLKECILDHWKKSMTSGCEVEDLEDVSKYHIGVLNYMNQYFDSHLDISNSFINTNLSAPLKNKDEEVQEELPDECIFTFHRQLSGGACINDTDEIYAPEGVVRNLNLEHGDKVAVIKNELGYNRHLYEKLENLPQDDTIEPNNIMSFDFAVASKIPDIEGRYNVYQYYSDEGLTSMPNRVIHSNDVQKFKIKDGDLIHVAFYDEGQNARVRWKYSHDEPIPTPKPQKSSVYKDNHSTPQAPIEQTLEGLTIGVIGYGNLDTSYEEEVTKRGGTMLTTSSVDAGIIENKVRQSDIVVIPTHYMGHGQMDITKSLCKSYEKPLVIINKGGRSHFIQQLHEKLTENK